MTLDQFWHSNPRILQIYIDAHMLKVEEWDRMNWILGSYILSAIGAAFGKNVKYDKKPKMFGTYEDSKLTQEERDAKEIQDQINDMRLWSQNSEKAGLGFAHHTEENKDDE